MARIERIEGGRGRPSTLILDNGEEIVTAGAVVRSLALAPDSEFQGAHQHAFAAAQAECARERALRLLGYRERSTAELRRRLTQDGYPEPVAVGVVESLATLGLVDDERYAQLYVRSRAAAGYGRRRIEHELLQNGLEPSTATAALDDTVPCDGELERARSSLRGRIPEERAERERAVARLIRRGFDPRDAWQAVAGAPPDELLGSID